MVGCQFNCPDHCNLKLPPNFYLLNCEAGFPPAISIYNNCRLEACPTDGIFILVAKRIHSLLELLLNQPLLDFGGYTPRYFGTPGHF